MFEPLVQSCLAFPAEPHRPVEFLVRKDGKPFAILNASPALIQRTLAGFMLASPTASWSVERV
ncbi:MAG TPA: hypothetical protein VK196_21550 [Magnetospirillum sp.]|nr:hypothetical protein [Magnetospirillum sp.]